MGGGERVFGPNYDRWDRIPADALLPFWRRAWKRALRRFRRFDEGAIRAAVAEHLRRLRLPSRPCVVHRGWTSVDRWAERSDDPYARMTDDDWEFYATPEWPPLVQKLQEQERSLRDPMAWERHVQIGRRDVPFPVVRTITAGSLSRVVRRLTGSVLSLWRLYAKDLAWAKGEGPRVPRSPWRPLGHAVRSGLLLLWVTQDAAHVLPFPKLHLRLQAPAEWGWMRRFLDGRVVLHREDGPAAEWADGSGFYFWRGQRVPREMITDPLSIRISDILQQRNAEVRRAMIERKGPARFLREADAKKRDQSEWGTLYEVAIPGGGERWVMLEVTCPSTGRTHLLRVPPWMRSAKQAVAWTFDCDARAYRPALET